VADAGPFPARNEHPCHSIRGWAVCYTNPQAERWAETGLRRQGYTTFLPLIAVRRRDRVLRSLWHTVEVPIFSRYLFIRFNHRAESWSPIRDTPGVRDLIRIGAEVQYAPEAAVSALEAAIAERATHGPETTQWAPGAPVALLAGALRGHPAVVLSTHGEHATLAVLLFGALRQVTAPVAWLVARQ
jgi:transcriptional antiterminator RfaH